MRISDWSSDVCSSDLLADLGHLLVRQHFGEIVVKAQLDSDCPGDRCGIAGDHHALDAHILEPPDGLEGFLADDVGQRDGTRSEEHTSELQSLMRISYAVFCLKKKKKLKKAPHTKL